jgi:hypothetical protein
MRLASANLWIYVVRFWELARPAFRAVNCFRAAVFKLLTSTEPLHLKYAFSRNPCMAKM